MIENVNERNDGFELTLDDGWHLVCPKPIDGYTPEVGDTARLFGKGHGYEIRGIVIFNGYTSHVCRYESKYEMEQRCKAEVDAMKESSHQPNPISPTHYSKYKRQPIDFIADMQADYFLGNIIKYIVRYRDKNGVEDLRKASEYLRRYLVQARNRHRVHRMALWLFRLPRRIWLGVNAARCIDYSVAQWRLPHALSRCVHNVIEHWYTLDPWYLVNAAAELDYQIKIEESK